MVDGGEKTLASYRLHPMLVKAKHAQERHQDAKKILAEMDQTKKPTALWMAAGGKQGKVAALGGREG